MAAKIPETSPSPEIPSNFKYTPLEHLRSTFVGFLQGLFYYAPNGCYHWEPDENDTEIVIQDEGTVREEVIAKRPAITLVRGPIQFSTVSLDDMESYDADIARKTKSVIVSGSVTINCLSRVSLESEKIAWIVMEHIWLLREVLLRAGMFETGRGPQMGSPSPAGSIVADDKGDEYTVTPVMMPIQFVRQSSFMPLGTSVVSDIINRISSRVPKMTGQRPMVAGTIGGPPDACAPIGDHEYPVQVGVSPPGSFYPEASDSYGRTPSIAGPADRLPKIPHPLNPAKEVFVRQVRPCRSWGRRG